MQHIIDMINKRQLEGESPEEKAIKLKYEAVLKNYYNNALEMVDEISQEFPDLKLHYKTKAMTTLNIMKCLGMNIEGLKEESV